MNEKSKNNFWVVVVLMLIILAIVSFTIYNSSRPASISNQDNGVIACTADAKLCPDGSAVGRTGPNCEFAECPAVVVPETWKTFSDPGTGASFKYPPTLGTTYVMTVDWPPKVQVMNEPIVCTDAGNPIDRAGQTKTETINSRTYCVTEVSEGAAGSIYNQYAYGVSAAGKYVILTFTLREPQCANYNDPQKSQCMIEENNLNIGNTIDQIVSTLNINQ